MTRIGIFMFAVCAMCVIVTASNILVQYPFHFLNLEKVLTYGALVYPFSFFVNDLTNRSLGQKMACRVVYAGFFTGLLVSWWLTTPRFAVASGSAFFLAQLVDISVFTPLRYRIWWKAPLIAAFFGSCLDSILFFFIAFSETFNFIDTGIYQPDHSSQAQVQLFTLSIPVWLSLAISDFFVKIFLSCFMLVPYGVIITWFMPSAYTVTRTRNSR